MRSRHGDGSGVRGVVRLDRWQRRAQEPGAGSGRNEPGHRSRLRASWLSLWLSLLPPTGRRPALAQRCGSVVVLIGLLKLCDVFLGWNSGIDRLLFPGALETVTAGLPNRMAPTRLRHGSAAKDVPTLRSRSIAADVVGLRIADVLDGLHIQHQLLLSHRVFHPDGSSHRVDVLGPRHRRLLRAAG